MLDLALKWAVIMLPFLFAVGVDYLIPEEKRDSPHWKVRIIAFGIGISALTWVQMQREEKIAKADRQDAIVETSKRVSGEVSESVSKSVAKAVGDQYAQTINELHKEIVSLQSQLQSQLRAQGKAVNEIRGSNIVTGKNPIKVEIANPGSFPNGEVSPDIHVSSMSIPSDPRYGTVGRQIIMTTNKTMDGARVDVVCKNKVNQGTAEVSGASVTTGGAQMVDDRTFQVRIETPNWSADRPLVVKLYSDQDAGTCIVRPLL